MDKNKKKALYCFLLVIFVALILFILVLWKTIDYGKVCDKITFQEECKFNLITKICKCPDSEPFKLTNDLIRKYNKRFGWAESNIAFNGSKKGSKEFNQSLKLLNKLINQSERFICS